MAPSLSFFVIPANAGIQSFSRFLDSRLRGSDKQEEEAFFSFPVSVPPVVVFPKTQNDDYSVSRLCRKGPEIRGLCASRPRKYRHFSSFIIKNRHFSALSFVYKALTRPSSNRIVRLNHGNVETYAVAKPFLFRHSRERGSDNGS
ncbi:MAG: hypothetical protein MI741_16340 [Rhodospirillales bacterium]|nr:hypothetical protein [Rhodospirillales bacterium]